MDDQIVGIFAGLTGHYILTFGALCVNEKMSLLLRRVRREINRGDWAKESIRCVLCFDRRVLYFFEVLRAARALRTYPDRLFITAGYDQTRLSNFYITAWHPGVGDGVGVFGGRVSGLSTGVGRMGRVFRAALGLSSRHSVRSEEHTSELQSRPHLVCRL